MSPDLIRKIRSPLILGLDLVAILGIFSGIYYLRLAKFPDYFSVDLWLIAATFIIGLFLSGTYFRERRTNLPTLPIRTFWVCIVGGMFCVVWLYLLGPSKFTEYFGRGILPVATIVCGVVTTGIRYIVNRAYHRQEQGTELLYLGYSSSATAFLDELQNHSEVRSVTISTKQKIDKPSKLVKKVEQNFSHIKNHEKWHSVIIDPSHHSDPSELSQLVSLRMTGTPVLSLADFYEKYWYMIPIQGINDDWFLASQGFSMLENPISRRIKRIIDLTLSLALIPLALPLVFVSGILIKVTSKGPLFFKQARVGLRGKEFTIYKLRTMRHDAEVNGAQWAKKNDPRVTRVGNILRQTRLDELPQCWNVLQGNMSFVGPRPERPEFTKQLTDQIPYYDLRHLVKPGITGWAQVIFPYGASVDDSLRKLQYELFYIKNQSLTLDLNIMLRTLITVFQRAGR